MPSLDLITTPDGVTLAVHEWGNPSGPPVLLIHGLRQSHLCFTPQQAQALASQCRIVAYDVRGHGLSDKPLDAGFYQSNERWAAEVQAVIDAKRLHRPVLVGWSMGGRIAAQYLVVYGDAALGGINFVGARAVADPAFSGGPILQATEAAPRDLAGQIEAASRFLRACFHQQPSAADFTTALAYNMLVPEPVLAAIRDWPVDIDATRAALRAVRVPVLVSHGRRDRLVLPASAEHTAELVPGATISWYEDTGHAPFAEDPARFNQELARFATEAAG